MVYLVESERRLIREPPGGTDQGVNQSWSTVSCYNRHPNSIVSMIPREIVTGRKVISPPPFFWQRYGNLQTFPKPTAKPTVARMNSALWPQVSRCSLPPSPLSAVPMSVEDFPLGSWERSSLDLWVRKSVDLSSRTEGSIPVVIKEQQTQYKQTRENKC